MNGIVKRQVAFFGNLYFRVSGPSLIIFVWHTNRQLHGNQKMELFKQVNLIVDTMWVELTLLIHEPLKIHYSRPIL